MNTSKSIYKIQILAIAAAVIGFLVGVTTFVAKPSFVGWLGTLSNIALIYYWAIHYQKPEHEWLCVYETDKGSGRIFITCDTKYISTTLIKNIEEYMRDTYKYPHVHITNLQYIGERYES